MPVADQDRSWAREQLYGCPTPWLLLAVGSRWATKRWPAAHFARLVQQAQECFGGTAVFVGGPEDRELSQAAAAQLAGPWRDLTGATTLPQLAAVLSLADVVLANDTGPLHLAAALGRPVVAPYTCTRIRLHGPYGGETGAVATTVPCHGSYLKRCHKMICMDELTPERLWPTLHGVLSAWQSNRRSA